MSGAGAWPANNSTNLVVRGKPINDLSRETDLPFLHPSEWAALVRMPDVIGYPAVAQILQLPDAEVKASVQQFLNRELQTREELVQRQEVGLTSLQASLKASLKASPGSEIPKSNFGLKLKLSSYSGKESESLRRWFVEIQTGITARRITDEATKVAFALSHLAGPARAWGFNRLLANPDCFPTYDAFKDELASEYEPPRTLHRAIAEFLELQQGKLSLHDYIQQMRYLISCANDDPPSESTQVTHFMRGLRTGHVRDEVYRHCPDTFDEAVRLALDAEFNFRQQKFDSGKTPGFRSFKAFQAPKNDGPTPMDISTIHASNHNRFSNGDRFQRSSNNNRKRFASSNNNQRDRSKDTCHRCQKKGHWAPDCKAPRRMNSSNGRPDRPSNGAHTKNELLQ